MDETDLQLEPDEDASRQQDQIARLYKQIFEEDKRGKLIFQDLYVRFGRDLGVTDGGIDAVLKTYQNIGKQAVLDHILRMCDRADGKP